MSLLGEIDMEELVKGDMMLKEHILFEGLGKNTSGK